MSTPSTPAAIGASPGPQPSSQPAPGQPQSGGTVGTGNYEVQQGDCIESIAMEHGFFWETIWKHPDNQQLKTKRKQHNVLLAGDKVFIPELRPKQEGGATEKRHRFKRKGVPSQIRIVLKDENEQPFAHFPYVLEIDGQLFSGTTDASGLLKHSIPPDAKKGKIRADHGQRVIEYTLELGGVDPITEISGAQIRLLNLGYFSGNPDGEIGPDTRDAIRSFQTSRGLPETGELDETTRQRLQEAHKS